MRDYKDARNWKWAVRESDDMLRARRRRERIELWGTAFFLLLLLPLMVALWHDAWLWENVGSCAECIVLDKIRPGLAGEQ